MMHTIPQLVRAATYIQICIWANKKRSVAHHASLSPLSSCWYSSIMRFCSFYLISKKPFPYLEGFFWNKIKTSLPSHKCQGLCNSKFASSIPVLPFYFFKIYLIMSSW